ncbi:MAG: RNA polymerase sigma factor [Candidatus Eisenbacteria bacterium]|uniref:RNA polymerase sigma factor n=1 Tax=Eiseniibacteriota bacterium TaxID=2212470 RepID=A0A948RZ89_UNCEI|nr:RNA polymerase sigma factor [Candidatus Eisenbacteria bacterium]MBU1948087.1 RNA polymerase sigma factor [Candidatus Eisenbacteria bacterium]MBU2692368.1 RNA polymerase sigma factor [Candidatus Eisenbacteria bacterium]
MTHNAPENESDRSLAAAILERREESAFRLLYHRHTPRLYQLVLRLVGGVESDAEDVVQETWMRACERLERFRWESAFSTWLRAIGLNVTRDLFRRRSRSPEALWEDPPDPPARVDMIAERIDLEGAIAELPAGCRQILVLYEIEGMKHAEIAAHLGISVGTSKSQLFSARRTLRQRLSAFEEKKDA